MIKYITVLLVGLSSSVSATDWYTHTLGDTGFEYKLPWETGVVANSYAMQQTQSFFDNLEDTSSYTATSYNDNSNLQVYLEFQVKSYRIDCANRLDFECH